MARGVAADVHGTLVNNLDFQTNPAGPQIATGAWEITTGAVAFDAPFGPSVEEVASALGLLSPGQVAGCMARLRKRRGQIRSYANRLLLT